MAQVTYTFRDTKKGTRCTGKVTLKCGYQIEETFLGRENDQLKEAVEGIIELRVRGHLKTCHKDH